MPYFRNNINNFNKVIDINIINYYNKINLILYSLNNENIHKS